MNNNIVEVALSYAGNGYLVFPCKPRRKYSIEEKIWVEELQEYKGGFYLATTDEEQIRLWWTENPEYNVAIRTGIKSGIIVLDIDEGGEETLKERGWNTPPTAMVKTADGWHYYFKHPGFPVKNRTGDGALGPGVEVKGDNGYVVAPPSIHPVTGEPYEWAIDLHEVELPDCPEWLRKAITEGSSSLTAPIEATIEEGSRNKTLFSRARSLFAQGYNETEVFGALYVVNQNRCNPPLDDNELEGIVRSAAKYERGELRIEVSLSPSPKENGNDYSDTQKEVGILMTEVLPEKVNWLWDKRIPLGKLTILDGDPSLGKSVITMDFAARVTTGRAFPDGNVDHLDHLGNVGHVGGIVILSAEDGLADTIRPRLDAAGADVSKIVAISTVPDLEGNERTLAIPEDIATIEQAIKRVDAKLVIVDPLMAFLSGKANHDQDVRKALTPLARMAERTGVAVLVIRHLNKQQGGKAIYRGGSSIGIIGAARSGMVVEKHPDNKKQRVLAMNKANLAEEAESLTYTITTAENDAAKVSWGGTSELDANDILNPDTTVVGEAMEWLKDRLGDGGLPQKTVMDEGKERGFSERTIRRAKEALEVQSKKDGLGGTWNWYLQDGQGGQDSQDGQDGQHSQGSQDLKLVS